MLGVGPFEDCPVGVDPGGFCPGGFCPVWVCPVGGCPVGDGLVGGGPGGDGPETVLMLEMNLVFTWKVLQGRGKWWGGIWMV